MQDNTDAFGAALMDCLNGKEDHYIVERDDMFADPGSLTQYFSEVADWPEFEKHMLDFVHGRVLDIGCGAGRHCLHLQSIGLEVVGIDNSPLALEVCKRRGVRDVRLLSIDQLASGWGETLGVFTSIIMMCNNLGLLHGFEQGKKTLRRFAEITTSDARIIAVTRNPYQTDNPDHLEYQAEQRAKGRMSGQIRFRIRHRKLVGSWMDYLFVSEEELAQIADGTGWKIEQTIKGDGGSYLAILCKAQ